MDGGALWAAVYGVAEGQTQLSDFTFAFHFHALEKGNGNPLQYSCLENPMDGGALWATVHGVAESRTRLSNFTFTFHFPPVDHAVSELFTMKSPGWLCMEWLIASLSYASPFATTRL